MTPLLLVLVCWLNLRRGRECTKLCKAFLQPARMVCVPIWAFWFCGGVARACGLCLCHLWSPGVALAQRCQQPRSGACFSQGPPSVVGTQICEPNTWRHHLPVEWMKSQGHHPVPTLGHLYCDSFQLIKCKCLSCPP